ncbi:NAD(P)H-dependent oxidoreductase [Alicyclobacillus herbarius]|nr:NAD(P)H-dependent oxidoreductase [Alicyclobacillus herbarius]
MTRIALISGSPSEPSRLAAVLQWLSHRFEAHGIDTQTILVRPPA